MLCSQGHRQAQRQQSPSECHTAQQSEANRSQNPWSLNYVQQTAPLVTRCSHLFLHRRLTGKVGIRHVSRDACCSSITEPTVRHDRGLLLWRRQWHPTPVLLPGKFHGRRSLVGCSPWGRKESDTAEQLLLHFTFRF